jgi:CRISPR/Cas system-associated exonuclease Cas4 (RecB family)
MKAWSFSSLSDYLNCPRSYQLKRVTKELPFVETDAMKYGTECHLYLENRMAKKEPLPPHLEWLEGMMDKVERSGGNPITEEKLALTRDLTPTTWFGKATWCRGIIDGGVRYRDKSVLYDYKTGKRKNSHDQLMLFAAIEFAHQPNVKEVKTGYVWLKDKAIDSKSFTRADVPMIWQHFLPKVEKMEKAHLTNDFPARPTGLCPWCPASKAQCKHKV